MQPDSWIHERGQFNQQRIRRQLQTSSYQLMRWTQTSRSTISISDLSLQVSSDDDLDYNFSLNFELQQKKQTKSFKLKQQQVKQNQFIRTSCPISLNQVYINQNKTKNYEQINQIRRRSSSQKCENIQLYIKNIKKQGVNNKYSSQQSTIPSDKEQYQQKYQRYDDRDSGYDSDYAQFSMQKTRIEIDQLSQTQQWQNLKNIRMATSQIITEQQRLSLEIQLQQWIKNSQNQKIMSQSCSTYS